MKTKNDAPRTTPQPRLKLRTGLRAGETITWTNLKPSTTTASDDWMTP